MQGKKRFVTGLFYLLTIVCFFAMTANSYAKAVILKHSKYDKRQYKYLVLKNNLKVLLVSDVDAKKTAVSLNVNTGHIYNPSDRQGLAHFIEHMLFLGSKHYGPDSLMQYISNHGGSSNAFTMHENTNFFFSVQDDALSGALSRFADMFASPNLSAHYIAKELNAVSSEHQKNSQQDMSRLFRVIQATGNPNHPYHLFATGNTETLYHNVKDKKEDLQKAAKAFYKEHYKASAMQLAIISKQPLATLEKEVRSKFTAIADGKVATASWKGKPVFTKDPIHVTINPIGDRRTLLLLFPIESKREEYKNKLLSVVSYVLGTESKGSVIDLLRSKGWISQMGLDQMTTVGDQSAITVGIDLTRTGLKHQQEIIDLFFAYVEKMKKQADWKEYYHEQEVLALNNREFGEKPVGTSYAISLSMSMRYVNPEDLIIFPSMYAKYDDAKLQNILKAITPKNMYVYAMFKQNKKDLASFKTDRWYKVQYKVQKQTHKIQTESKLYKTSLASFQVPQKNEFIPERLQVNDKPKLDAKPSLLSVASKGQLWYRYNNKFRKPTSYVKVRISLPNSYDTAQHTILTYLYKKMVSLSLQRKMVAAEAAGLYYNISLDNDKGIYISLSGFAEKQPLLFDNILSSFITVKKMKNMQRLFELSKQASMQEFKNAAFEPAYKQVIFETNMLVRKHEFSHQELAKALSKIKFADLKQFMPTLFSKKHYIVFVEGSVQPTFAKQLYTQLETKLGASGARDNMTTSAYLVVPQGKTTIAVRRTKDVNRALFRIYYIQKPTMKQRLGVALYNNMIGQPFFQQLRTKEQLGYIVQVTQQAYIDHILLGFLIQSKKKPLYLQQRVDLFLQKNQASLAKQKAAFTVVKKTMLHALTEDLHLSLESYFTEDWQEITMQRFDFNRRKKLAAVLKPYSLQDVKTVVSKMLSAKNQRQLAVYGYAKGDRVKKSILKQAVVKKTLLQQKVWHEPIKMALPKAVTVK